MTYGSFPAGTKELKKYTLTGVYFLLLDNKVVYVGKAKNIYSRIHSHILHDRKLFNRVKYKEYDESELDAREYLCIQRFMPKYNIVHNGARKIISRNIKKASLNDNLSIKEYIARNNL